MVKTMHGKVRYGGVKLLIVYLFWCWVSLWLSSMLSSSDSSNTGQKGRCTTTYMHSFEKNGAKNVCLPDAIFFHIRFSLLSSSSCIAYTSLSLLLNCSSLLRKSSSLLSSCPSRIPICTSLAATITSRSHSVFSACAKYTFLRRSVSSRCISCLAMFYQGYYLVLGVVAVCTSVH